MKKPYLIVFMILISIAVTAIGFLSFYNQKKVGYVRADVLFSDFKMTKELKEGYENAFNARTNILDSMMLELKKVSLQKDKAQTQQAMEKDYWEKKDLFVEQNEEMTRKYDEQVWLRINQYVKAFSEKEKYDLIMGANGSGSLMYGAPNLDITQQVLEYMNTSYEGLSKK
jgi:outer membrane protein